MIDKLDTGQAVWQRALAELELQMTRATFDTWLRDSRALALASDGVLTIGVRNRYAVEWLSDRLFGPIARALANQDDALRPRFIVAEPAVTPATSVTPAPAPAQVWQEPDYDPHDAGWFPVAAYETQFWAPLLGRIAWRVWEIVRQGDKRRQKSPWTMPRRFTAPGLAAEVPCGKQALIGAKRRCAPERAGAALDTDGVWRYHQEGAFDRLEREGVADIERRGGGAHVTYWIQVKVKLGLLHPTQVRQLRGRLQVEHDRWLADRGLDPAAWDVLE